MPLVGSDQPKRRLTQVDAHGVHIEEAEHEQQRHEAPLGQRQPAPRLAGGRLRCRASRGGSGWLVLHERAVRVAVGGLQLAHAEGEVGAVPT